MASKKNVETLGEVEAHLNAALEMIRDDLGMTCLADELEIVIDGLPDEDGLSRGIQ